MGVVSIIKCRAQNRDGKWLVVGLLPRRQALRGDCGGQLDFCSPLSGAQLPQAVVLASAAVLSVETEWGLWCSPLCPCLAVVGRSLSPSSLDWGRPWGAGSQRKGFIKLPRSAGQTLDSPTHESD